MTIKEQRDALWQLLDDIDTLDDSCRENDAVFRERVRHAQKKRWAIHNPDARGMAATMQAGIDRDDERMKKE